MALREAFPDATVVGSTSAAEISSPGGYQEDSITLAMFASDVVDVTTGLGTGLSRDSEAACRAAVAQALADTDREPKVCVMLAEAFGADPQATLDAMARALPGRSGHRRWDVGGPRLQCVATVVPVRRRRRDR